MQNMQNRRTNITIHDTNNSSSCSSSSRFLLLLLLARREELRCTDTAALYAAATNKERE